MAIVVTAYDAQAASIGIEHLLVTKTGVIGIYVLVADTSAMESDDTVELRIKTKCRTEDQQQEAYISTFSGVQEAPNKYSVPVPVDVEIACTLTQTAGTTGKTFPWKLLRA